MTLWLCPRH